MIFAILYWLIAGSLITAIVLKRYKDDRVWIAEHLALAEEMQPVAQLGYSSSMSASVSIHLKIK